MSLDAPLLNDAKHISDKKAVFTEIEPIHFLSFIPQVFSPARSPLHPRHWTLDMGQAHDLGRRQDSVYLPGLEGIVFC